MYCKVIIYHSSHYMAWCTRSTTPIYRRNTRKHTQGFTMGKTGSLAHCTYSEWNTAVISRLLTLLIFLNFISFRTSLLPPMGYFIISCFFFHTPPSPKCSLFAPLSSRIPWQPTFFSPPLLCSSCHLVFYKHNMYRNSTQTNMFLIFFFFSYPNTILFYES